VLLDECAPRQLRRELPGHEIQTVQEMNWAGTKNGVLLELVDGHFEVVLTVDQGIEYQQSLGDLAPPGFEIIVTVARSNNVDDLRPLMPAVRDTLARIRPLEVTRIAAGE
jgi:hypothetical protein